MRFIRLAWSLPIVVAAVACGSGDEGGGSSAAHVEPKIAELATAVCNLSFSCCSRGEVDWFMGPWIDATNCAERFVTHASLSASATIDLQDVLGIELTVPNVAGLESAVSAGRIAIDEPGLQACLGFIQAQQCNQHEEAPEGCVPPDPPPEETPCHPRKVFVGKLSEGATCTSSIGSLECLPGLTCRSDGETGVYGRCVPIGQVGDPCESDSACDEQLYCSKLDGTCQAFRSEGETCVFADRDDPAPPPETALIRCRADLSCDPLTDTCVVACKRGASCQNDEQCDENADLECIQGRCDLRRSAGLPCASSDDCQDGLLCVDDLANPGSKICGELLANAAVCNVHDECASEFCHPDTGRCTAPLPPGSLCPTQIDAECQDGRCVQEGLSCTLDTDCPVSKKCDLTSFSCASYCVELLPDGATCSLDGDCASGACVASFCRSLPLANGQGCENHSQCDSEFCSLGTDPVCKELPLGLGETCELDSQCASNLCFAASASAFEKTCITGLEEGSECGKSGQPPCNPNELYCDTDEKPPICVPLLETGEACESDNQCRGTCTIRHNRKLCTPEAAPEAAVCDGNLPGGS